LPGFRLGGNVGYQSGFQAQSYCRDCDLGLPDSNQGHIHQQPILIRCPSNLQFHRG
jgi:hypothetical protein